MSNVTIFFRITLGVLHSDALSVGIARNIYPCTRQLFFDKMDNTENKDDEQKFEDNVTFGLVCGKLEVANGKVKAYNGDIANIRTIVSQVTKTGDRVCSFSESDLELLPVHTKGFTGSVTYFGTEPQLQEIEKKVCEEGGFVIVRTDAEDNVITGNTAEEGQTEKDESIVAESVDTGDESMDSTETITQTKDSFDYEDNFDDAPMPPFERKAKKRGMSSDCLICKDTQYTCENCGQSCCSVCAKFDEELEDRSRGHGYIRNHMPDDPRCTG